MRIPFILSLLLLLCGCKTTNVKSGQAVSDAYQSTAPIRIAFGSCGHQNKPQPLLNVAADLQPDYFIYLGDNIYGDSRNMNELKRKYAQLASKQEFKYLKQNTKLLSVWDDHDYGENDAGRHYPFKEESKQIFMDFFEVPADSDRRNHPGIYGTQYLEKDGMKLQIIMLDTRTFRDELRHRKSSDVGFKNDYVPYETADSTLLGTIQWAWLEEQFKMPADIRIIASSNQFSHEYNGWESWTNLPHEQQRMIDLIKKTKANGVIFISGDVHWGELSKRPVDNAYPIYDVTSSGITQVWDSTEPNKYRVGDVIRQNNIGLIELTPKENGNIQVDFGLLDITRQKVVSHRTTKDKISF